MRHDFSSPLSDAAPCGVDLEQAGDAAYGNYMLLAYSRLPETYFTVVDEVSVPFDKKSVDLDAERTAIDGLLARSRDIRLLALEARFTILAGDLVGFSDIVQDIAVLVSEYWNSCIPLPAGDDDFDRRRSAVEELTDQIQVLLPLQYAPLLVEERALPAVTYRNYIVAAGRTRARQGEATLLLDQIRTAVASDQAADRITRAYDALRALRAAVATIAKTFSDKASYPAPNLEPLITIVSGMTNMLVELRPSLLPPEPVDAPEGSDDGEASDRLARKAVTFASIADRQGAIAAIRAAGDYFRRAEPSSPALILVHQATELIGRPLVEALAALMPKASSAAVIRFGSNQEFDIDIERMRSITSGALAVPVADLTEGQPAAIPTSPTVPGTDLQESTDGDEDRVAEPPPLASPPQADATKVPVARTRAEATGMMIAAEAYFRTAEPSSPVPLLLERARGLLDKDFSTIVRELSPSRGT